MPALAFVKSTYCRNWGFSSASPIHKIKNAPLGVFYFLAEMEYSTVLNILNTGYLFRTQSFFVDFLTQFWYNILLS